MAMFLNENNRRVQPDFDYVSKLLIAGIAFLLFYGIFFLWS